MSKWKISSYLGGERNEETEKDKDQNDLRIEVAEGDGNTNPKVAKMSNESHNFQSNYAPLNKSSLLCDILPNECNEP